VCSVCTAEERKWRQAVGLIGERPWRFVSLPLDQAAACQLCAGWWGAGACMGCQLQAGIFVVCCVYIYLGCHATLIQHITGLGYVFWAGMYSLQR
jgi:hypothetical protein